MSTGRIEHKIGKAKYGPSLNEVILGAALSLLLGAFLATVYLVMRPVAVVRELPKAPEANVVYYAEGTKNFDHAKQWLRKKQLFLEGSSVTVNEDELNVWIRAEAGTAASPAPAPAGEVKTAQAGSKPLPSLFQVDSPNFRVRNGTVQLSCRITVSVELFGLSVPLIVQSMGRFEKRGDIFSFVPDTCYVGSFPVHKLPGLDGVTLGFLLARVPVSEEIRAAWKKLTNVAVEGDTLRLSMP